MQNQDAVLLPSHATSLTSVLRWTLKRSENTTFSQ